MFEPQHVLRLWLIVLGVEIGGDEAHRLDEIAAHGLREAAQIRGGGDHASRVWACAAQSDSASARPAAIESGSGFRTTS